MRRLLASVLLAPFVLAAVYFLTAHGAEGESKLPADGEKPKTYQGLSASLTVASSECKVDEPMNVTVRFDATRDSQTLFNPFFNGLLEQPGRILIRDSDGKIVNRLLEFEGGSRRGAGAGDYVYLPHRAFLGCEVSIYPARVQKGLEAALPPGNYTMQLVLHGSLLRLDGENATKEVVTTKWVAFRIAK